LQLKTKINFKLDFKVDTLISNEKTLFRKLKKAPLQPSDAFLFYKRRTFKGSPAWQIH
jgi:hypothetical protein